jgi:diguanylate cyclase (GGDEF)-like protein/PAS domain S-box-containing protein
MSPETRSRFLLFLSYGLLIAVLTAIVAFGMLRLDTFSRQLTDVTDAQGQRTGVISELFRSNDQRALMIDRLFMAGTPEHLERAEARYREALERFEQALARVRALPLPGAGRGLLEQAVAAAADARAAGEETVELLRKGQFAPASELNMTQAVLADGRLQESLYRLLEASHAESERAVGIANRGVRHGFLLIGAGGLFALLASTLVAVWVIRVVGRTEERLAREKELAEVTLHSIVDGVVTTDALGRIEYMNPVAERYLGWRGGEVRGRPLKDIYRIIDERTGEALDPEAASVASEGVPEPMSVRLVDRNGRECPIRYSHAPIRGREGAVHGTVVVFHDVSQIRAMAQQLTWQASHDALTGLVNRREFERRLAALIDTAKQQHREHALLYLDLDNFKSVNDTCGHAAGDELLRQLTIVMQTRMRGSDTLARLGGDEFGALLDSCPLGQAMRIANGLRETIREFRFVWQDKTFSVGVSIGLVPIGAESGDVNQLLTLADVCCYEAKKGGRDRVQVYRSQDRDDTGRQGDLLVVSEINRAFEQGQFRLYRQFMMPLNPGRGRAPHHEVLVRMVDSSGVLVPPTGFMPAAERYNLLTSIERWVVSTLVEYLHRQWTRGGIPREPDASGERGYYSVNISGASINDGSFPDFLRNLLTRYELPNGLLCFEITETTAISNLTKAAELVHELKGMGCRFALDDFGTGMSSFAYLKYLPVDYLKIAGIFIEDMVDDPMDYAIVEAINRISHILGMQTVAESVENAETLARLKALGVDYAQGYFIAQPEALDSEAVAARAVLSA